LISKEQALTVNEFHIGECKRTVGPRGGVKIQVFACRRNGQTKTWVTRPNEFRVPIKHGFRECGYITDDNNHKFHVASECPLGSE